MKRIFMGISCLLLVSCATPDYRERKKIVIRPVRKEKMDEEKVIRLTLEETANFNFDRAEVIKSDKKKLDEFIGRIEGLKGTLIIIGHTDTKGSYEYNDQLSLKRARAVKDYISERMNLFDYTVKVSGRGEYETLIDERVEAGRAKNRRVEIIFRED